MSRGWAAGVALVICPVGLGVVGRGHALYPAFVPDTQFLLPALQKWQLDFFLVFLYLLSRVCPNCACRQLILVLYSFFVFCCSEERCVQAQAF